MKVVPKDKFDYSVGSVEGMIRKSHPKSIIAMKPLRGDDDIFDARFGNPDGNPPIILQIVPLNEYWAIFEYVFKDDFDVPNRN